MPMYPYSSDPRRRESRFAIRVGFFRGARKLWNCLAFHLVVDDTLGIMRFSCGIPGLFTVFTETPLIPDWLGAKRLAGGKGERAEYGLWHDFHETKLQWRKIINLSGRGSGIEKRWVHLHRAPVVTRRESLISHLVADVGAAWAEAKHLDSWTFMLSTWSARCGKWWIPRLYDHYFILTAKAADGIAREASTKTRLGPHMRAIDIFNDLRRQLPLE